MGLSKIEMAFMGQASSCQEMGSPFTGRLCSLLAANLPTTGVVWELMRAWEGDVSPEGDSVPLRFTGALHGLARNGQAAELQNVYPPTSQQVSDGILWSIIRHTVEKHTDYFLKRMKSPPQTNEVRRAGILLPGFMEIARVTGKDEFVMSELGASAGLNMFWDKFHYRYGRQEWGDGAAKTRIHPDCVGALPDFTDLFIRDRAACDLNPIDISVPENEELLLSYIWPDQMERMARTKAAIDYAARQPEKVEQSDAADWLKQRLTKPHNGAVHVVYHTVVWQYFPEVKKREAERWLSEAGARAHGGAPLAWLRLEADGKDPGGGLILTLWPSGETRTLARGDYHGRWIEWL